MLCRRSSWHNDAQLKNICMQQALLVPQTSAALLGSVVEQLWCALAMCPSTPRHDPEPCIGYIPFTAQSEHTVAPKTACCEYIWQAKAVLNFNFNFNFSLKRASP